MGEFKQWLQENAIWKRIANKHMNKWSMGDWKVFYYAGKSSDSFKDYNSTFGSITIPIDIAKAQNKVKSFDDFYNYIQKREKKYFKENYDNGTWVILFNRTPLSAFHPNDNERVSNILKTSTKSYSIFPSEKEANEHLEYIKNQIQKETHYIDGLKDKLIKATKKLKVHKIK